MGSAGAHRRTPADPEATVLLELVEPWAELLLRWLHVGAAATWLGAAFVFRALDLNLRGKPGGAGEAWFIHDGSFYRARGHGHSPPSLPERLTRFRWPAYVTWAAGFGLLVLVYLAPAPQRLIDPAVAALSPGLAVGLALTSLLGGYLLYEALCRSPLVGHEVASAAAVGALLLGMALLNASLFAAPAALLLDGALAGTIMVANVAHVVVPGERRTIAALQEGRAPDPAWASRAHQRLLHNDLLTPVVVLAMVAGHAAPALLVRYSAALLALGLLAGAALAMSTARGPSTPVRTDAR